MEIVCCSKLKDTSKGLPLKLKNRKRIMSSKENDNLQNNLCEQHKKGFRWS